MARWLKTNTATIVTVGPFYDKTDGVTIETGLTITNERISFTVDANDGSAPTLVLDNVTGATSGTSNDLNYITNCDAGLMQIELSATNTNYLGRAFLSITDAANHVPVFHEFMILPAMVYDSLVAGTDTLQADTTQWLGQACAAVTTNGVPEVDITHIAGAAVSTSTAQLGVNLVNVAGSAVNASSAQLGVNVVNAAGTAWGSGAITAASLAADAGTEIGTAVWATEARVLTAATNITSTDGEIPITAGGLVSADVTAISTDTTAANNAELAFDGTGFGFTGCTMPTVTTLTGHTAQTGDSFARLGAPAGASVSADIAAIKAETAAILVDTGTTLDGNITAIKAKTDSLTFTVAGDVDCNVQSWAGAAAPAMTGDAYARLGAPAGASVSADIAAVKSDSAAILVDTGTTLDGKIDTIDTNVDSILADTGTDGVVVAAGSKTGYALSSAGIDAVWDQASSITLSFETLLTRAYQMINNKMNVTDADGTVALRAIGDGSNIATGSVTDNSTTTTRLELTWA